MTESTWFRRAPAGVVGAVLAAPLLVLVVRAVADVWRAPAVVPQQFGLRGLAAVADVGAAVANAAGVAVGTTIVAVAIGWPAARWLAEAGRGGVRRRRTATVVQILIALPLLVSPFATGTGLLTLLLRLGLADTLVGIGVSHLVYVLPYVVLLLRPAFGNVLTDLEEAAGVLGAGRWQRLWWITVPSVRGPLAVVALLGLLVSWSQYGTSLAVGGGIPMLPVVLLPFVGRDPQVAATLGLVFVAPALIALGASLRWGRFDAR